MRYVRGHAPPAVGEGRLAVACTGGGWGGGRGEAGLKGPAGLTSISLT